MSKLSQALESGAFVVTAELAPPKGVDISKPLRAAERLKPYVTAMNVTDQQASVMRLAPLGLCRVLQEQGVEPIMQMTCRDRNRVALQADMLAAAVLGIENILCMTGDPSSMGDHPDAKPVFDVDVTTLVRMAATLQEGKDLAGHPLEGAPSFTIGAVANPGATPLEPEVVKLEKKVEVGATFIQTQGVFDVKEFERFRLLTKGIKVKVLAGIILLKSGNMARWMNKNIPGVKVTDRIIAEIDAAPDKEEACVEIASRTIRDLRGLCDGVHIMGLGWEEHIPAVLKAAGSLQPAT
ncbi:MAG: methylenetetrahydrofolate reductase [Chloroflexi bacterium]|nr:methylenetetrahydrofolate reductase [Chloroflexota bacterium]